MAPTLFYFALGECSIELYILYKAKGTSSVLFCLGRTLYGSVNPVQGPRRPHGTNSVLFCLWTILYGSVHPVQGPGRPQEEPALFYFALGECSMAL